MAFKILSGPNYNHLTRIPNAQLTASPSMHALYPARNAGDSRSSKAAVFSEAQEDSTLTADLNIITGGGFEDANDAARWTVLGVGTLTSDNGDSYNSTTASALLTKHAGASVMVIYQDVVVRAGEELTLFGACKKNTASGAVFRVRNRQTGKWLDDMGAWQASEDEAFEASGTGWETINLTFTVESLAVCGDDLVTLRIYLSGSAGNARFDEVALWPTVKWCSVHGHNVPPFIVPTLQRSSDGSAWTTASTITLRRDSFYHELDSLTSYRYWRLLFDGRPDSGSLIHLGEWVLGQSEDFVDNPPYGGSLGWVDKQTRLTSDLGEEFVHLHNVKAPQRRLMLPMKLKIDTEYQQFRDVFFRASRGGAVPIVIAPVEMDSSVVIMGRLREAIEVPKTGPYPRTGELEIIESPLPSVPDIVHVYDAPVVDEG